MHSKKQKLSPAQQDAALKRSFQKSLGFGAALGCVATTLALQDSKEHAELLLENTPDKCSARYMRVAIEEVSHEDYVFKCVQDAQNAPAVGFVTEAFFLAAAGAVWWAGSKLFDLSKHRLDHPELWS